MLGRAIQDHHPGVPQSKAPTLSQYYANAKANPLRPVPPAALNSSLPSFRNPLKRTASQANGSESSHGSQEQVIKKPMVNMNQHSANGGRVGKLHEAVDWDENDFDDDANIDLDEDVSQSTLIAQSSRQSSTTLVPDSRQSSTTLVGDASPKQSAPSRTPVSSTPLPWSSSPPSHHSVPQPKKAPIEEAPDAKITKRRKLPWLDEAQRQEEEEEARRHSEKTAGESQPANARQRMMDAGKLPSGLKGKIDDTDLDGKGIPASVQKMIKQGRDKKALAALAAQTFTPLPKDKETSKYPWNTSASAMKEQQKQLRQGNRKPTKDHEGDEVAKTNSKKKRQSIAKVFLSDEQRSVLELVSDKKKSVFFTGSAGTGKSILLREIIKILRDKYKKEADRVAVTASTGLAACNVGGVTLHSFAGIGLGKEAVPELVKKIKRNRKAKDRWLRTKILIIDEISMVDGDLFDKLESIARAMRNNGRPFGGIQLVITGDFFQLPPVPDYGRVSKFSFDASTWNTSIEHTIGLTQVFRQKDPVFANMLNEMRLGRLTPQSINAFRALNRPLSFGDDFEATELFPTRNEVDYANSNRMRNLSGREFEFKAEDGGSILDVEQRNKLLANCMAPPSISLKKGAQVMLIKNIDDTLVNGSVGKVIAFMDEKTFDIYHEDEDEFQAVETMDLDDEEMTKSRKKLKAMINKDLAGDTSQKWPLVRFAIADGSSRDLLCQRESWKIELPNGEVQASRSQIPLILAWALSIHKAQGQTLDRVKVDLGKIFEKGQAYVALSRATCQEGLQITRFDPKKVMAHDRVRTFYDSLYSVNQATASKALEADIKKQGVGAKEYENKFMGSTFDEDADGLEAMYG